MNPVSGQENEPPQGVVILTTAPVFALRDRDGNSSGATPDPMESFDIRDARRAPDRRLRASRHKFE
jgi:hypothetical protein